MEILPESGRARLAPIAIHGASFAREGRVCPGSGKRGRCIRSPQTGKRAGRGSPCRWIFVLRLSGTTARPADGLTSCLPSCFRWQ